MANQTAEQETAPVTAEGSKPKYPGIPVTCNGNQLVAQWVETRITEGGVYYPITPSTEGGEIYQQAFAQGALDVWGNQKLAVETEGEHAAQGGATAVAMTGKRTVNFTSGQGIVYAMEQYYHAPGKLSTMVLEVGARALTKHALNVHCGHDDFYAAMDTGWTMLMGRDAQQAADQAVILPFDYLIIASGTSYAENIKAVSPSLDYRLRQFAAERKSLEAAERVVIIGGGLIAMETCGEVRDAFPNKELILVCRSTILRKSGPVPHPILKADWEARGVRVVDHEAMLPLEDGATHYVTDKGTKVCHVEGTRAIWCTGRGAAVS